ncbi:MAG: S8 family peptidase, partial [Blastocatellia bacterium]
MTQPLRHILLFNLGSPERFTSPRLGRSKSILIPRDRQRHGQKLKKQLQEAARKGNEQSQQMPPEELVKKGFYIEFESDPGFELKVESLKGERQGIELVAVSETSSEASGAEGGQTPMKATVFVPEGKIGYFIKKIEEYLDPAKDSKKTQNPRNQPLVESIANIRLATLRSLWTDSETFPETDREIWWEIWLRNEGTEEERKEVVRKVRDQVAKAGLRAKSNEIVFPDTTVLLVRGQAEQITHSLFLMNALAEIRRAKETADFFINLKYGEQRDWVKEALSRVVEAERDAPAVCLLDTGVNREHPLIERSLSEQDMDSYNPAWGKADHHGHGTELAGIGLHGDLTDLFSSEGPINLAHKLESVKLVPPSGQNEPELYGDITAECMARAEVFAPLRNRAFCLATSAKESRDRGRPSSWSSAIDQFVSGAIDEDRKKRLILIAAGNSDPYAPGAYPDKNLTDEIHDPGQSWNAVTVGAYTEKDTIDPDASPGWMPLAPRGALCPTSTTAGNWIGTNWPFKPDVVFEGGNMATHPEESSPDYLDSLQLLTTYKDWRTRLLTVTGDTSAATALAARMSAQIMA